MKSLNDIGFYTLTDERARNSNGSSPLFRCELILTDACNFKCTYCRGLRQDLTGTMRIEQAMSILRQWCEHGLKNIRFSGGEPTLYKGLIELVKYCKDNNVERIALSTNGSASFSRYQELVEAGVNDFSISLDACCSSTTDKMCGIEGVYDTIIDNIRELSKLTYVTVGIVLTQDNVEEVIETVTLAHNLGVADIRIIPAAQFSETLVGMIKLKEITEEHPILKYRMENVLNGKSVRGLSEEDYPYCPLVLDDMAVAGNYHFPCIIYLREKGEAIGEMGDINRVRKERKEWAENHNCFEDIICRYNCLDVCRCYNSKWKEFHEKIL